ncbi:sn-glycerol-3-phosphate-binding periplasmic protein UgpB precursor [Serratia grimesii]|jgi:sn-glycerol 3-phosphate transport system substrate-binding protein|uniref:ABC transporter substrate-binding protein n=1 Tax=Serratia grimesii TaxID=82995 RepID=A0A7G2JMR0_9GAMM|nr:ABC transporter substrate-binding protein [Serratia grimesii]CAI0846095.1 glycerol-3-phosphate transporter periplasmic binding protein [Serratia grimesii]CAI0932091.1 glycerol-3-phosphate transporter periplasmic binding protein [Serratia grimesii]CAI1179402.1 glycerol-3-phosphate transporter periplasmic binding protein [Serratia grimesii]CAI2430885.1 glycerol-3-phosphate transporter periplasmic binding protein [Serratia grimesii]CUW18608.1 sn-glycerol-3-phosphate-binding periplasmic protein
MSVSIRLSTLSAAVLLFGVSVSALAADAVKLQMYYPIAVGGKISHTVEGLVADFEKLHPDISIQPVYTGDYATTVTKALTAFRGGNAPQIAVIGDIEAYSLIDAGAILPVSDLANDEAGKAWIDGFYPAFIRKIQGKVWSIPFQRSTVVLYWNKQAFQQAGLNGETPPANWQQVVDFGQKLVVRNGNEVKQWGIEIPSTPIGYWTFQGIAATNGSHLDNGKGTAVTFNTPANVEALTWLTDLAQKYQVSPKGAITWSTTPQDFIDGKTAMMVTTTGNLTTVRENAKFPFGVAMLPEKTQRGSPTGGGNLYLFKGTSPAQQKAAVTFMRWLSAPEQAARWSIATGYVATSPAAWETATMKEYAVNVPQATVAREQLAYSQPELSTYNSVQIQELLNRAVEAAVTQGKTPAQALESAQKQADRLLQRYQ